MHGCDYFYYEYDTFAQDIPDNWRTPSRLAPSYGVLKRYILNCYMHLSCKNTINNHTAERLGMTKIRRAKQHLSLCQICNAKVGRSCLSLLPFLHHKFM